MTESLFRSNISPPVSPHAPSDLFCQEDCEVSLAHCRGGRGPADEPSPPISGSSIVEVVEVVELTTLPLAAACWGKGRIAEAKSEEAFEPSFELCKRGISCEQFPGILRPFLTGSQIPSTVGKPAGHSRLTVSSIYSL